jgi:hypothetical protein
MKTVEYGKVGKLLMMYSRCGVTAGGSYIWRTVDDWQIMWQVEGEGGRL